MLSLIQLPGNIQALHIYKHNTTIIIFLSLSFQVAKVNIYFDTNVSLDTIMCRLENLEIMVIRKAEN